MCVLFHSFSGSSVLSRPRFRRSHGVSWKIRFSFGFLSCFFFPLHCVPGENVHPPPSAACACSERIPSRLCSACICATYTFPLPHPGNAGIVCFSCYLWTRLFLGSFNCAQLSTVVASSRFFWENLFVNAWCVYWLCTLLSQ